MVLNDASANNIQVLDAKPLLIDTLSFEANYEGRAWVAYEKLCQHFLAPLGLVSQKDVRLSQLLRVYIDGIPLGLAASLLPKRTYLNLGILMHVHLHARTQRRYAERPKHPDSVGSSRLGNRALINITDSLRSTVQGLRWSHKQTSWTGYYKGESYEDIGFRDKLTVVREYLEVVKPTCVWDLGANTGTFSRIASQAGIITIAMDSDPGVVEANYLRAKHDRDIHLLPLVIDLNNPSAAIGWANTERDSLVDRRNADCLLALARIHHIAISNNVPTAHIATYFANLSEWLIFEFVRKSPKQVKKLLMSRRDIFKEYSEESFERISGQMYEIVRRNEIQESTRVLYLLRRKATNSNS